MHIWTIEEWKKNYDLSDPNHRTGARLKFDENVDSEVKRACKDFMTWARTEYFFPMRVPIYIKASIKIKAMDGEMVSATCFIPHDHHQEPYIRIATGDYSIMLNKWGKDNALASIIRSIAHELTHYFQWINNLQLTDKGLERQATIYAGYILDEYAETRDHP